MTPEHFAYIYLAISLFIAASRAIPDALWAKLPGWLRLTIEIFGAIGSDYVKAGKKVAAAAKKDPS
jgi:hypothetical protein